MDQSRNGPGRSLESPKIRGHGKKVLRHRSTGRRAQMGKIESDTCGRPGCNRRLGRKRKNQIFCSDRCRWRSRDKELRRLRDLDFEGLVQSLACSECQGALLEALCKP